MYALIFTATAINCDNEYSTLSLVGIYDTIDDARAAMFDNVETIADMYGARRQVIRANKVRILADDEILEWNVMASDAPGHTRLLPRKVVDWAFN